MELYCISPLGLISFTQHDAFEIHPWANQFAPCYYWILCCWMGVSQCIWSPVFPHLLSNLLQTSTYRVLCEHGFSFHVGKYIPRNRCLVYLMSICILSVGETAKLLSKLAVPFCILISNMWVLVASCLHPHKTLSFGCCLSWLCLTHWCDCCIGNWLY